MVNREFIFRYEKYIFLVVVLILIFITFSTSYYGSRDIGDYADTAKFFAGEYSAKIRSSHSYLLGFLHAPFVGLMKSFLFFKITSVIFLALIVLSLYFITGKSRKVLWMALLSPIIWYMAPWINPIQVASLCMLWAYYFIDKYESGERKRDLIYSGLLLGLGLAFWDTILYFGVILALCFLYNKKTSHLFLFCFFALIGLLPRLILDQYLFNFAFFTTIKTFISGWVNLLGGIYQSEYGHTPRTFASVFSFLLAIPIYFWILYKPKNFAENKKTMLFLTLSLILLLMNPQIRYILALSPIMLVLINKYINSKELVFHFIGSILIIAFFTAPYLLQTKDTLNNQLHGIEATDMLAEGISFLKENSRLILIKDIEDIAKDFPDKVFVVGNKADDYQELAHFYWGREIKEFVSIQDYNAYLNNNSVLYKKRFEPLPNIPERRQFWIEGGLKKSDNDPTKYEEIEYGIGLGEPLRLDGFKSERKYKVLEVSKKI